MRSTQPVDAPLDRDGAIQQIHRELDQVRQVKKCTSGECLLDVLIALFLKDDRRDSDEACGAEAVGVPRPRVWHGG
jgi:hypothetical protein